MTTAILAIKAPQHFSQHVIAARIEACKKAFDHADVRDSDVSVGPGPNVCASVECFGMEYDVSFISCNNGIVAGILTMPTIIDPNTAHG